MLCVVCWWVLFGFWKVCLWNIFFDLVMVMLLVCRLIVER